MRLKELREERGFTQKDVAQAIQTSQSNIGRWEKGINEPAASYIIKLANLFDVSTDYILGIEDSDIPWLNNTSTTTCVSLPLDKKELIDIYDSLDEMHRVQVLEYARYFAERTQKTKKV